MILEDALAKTKRNSKDLNYQVERIRRRGVRALSGSPHPSDAKGRVLP